MQGKIKMANKHHWKYWNNPPKQMIVFYVNATRAIN